MTALFSKPKTPTLQAPPSVPQKSDKEIGEEQEKNKLKFALQKGKASTILSKGSVGDDSVSASGLATKKLTGG